MKIGKNANGYKKTSPKKVFKFSTFLGLVFSEQNQDDFILP